MRILVTGGAGFIGSNLAADAIRKGYSVRILDDFSTGSRDNLAGLDVELIEGSILDSSCRTVALSGNVDSVVHLAALGSVPRSIADPLASHAANATGTLEMLIAATEAKVKHFVYSSSSSVYGMNPKLPKHEREWIRPMSPYAAAKLAAEQYVLAAQQSYGLSTLALRFFNVYGPRQSARHTYAAVVPTFIDAMLSGRPVYINGDGATSRDFTFVGSVVRVLLEAVERGVTHAEPVNLAFGTRTTINELTGTLMELTNTAPAVVHREPRPGDVRHSQAANASLRDLFPGVTPVPLTEGLRATVDWYKRTEFGSA
ncbi:NAD-dependent epimerase/dehydratase family protein [Ornithinicoccus halotolerans]|uniref:NAD-dependent epimerase/dehydratase family protein n=1 Tax=Ornithinicoccus halotolerans TaxID=1748220 RepID=UPI001297F5D1|nr:NAD-dependent epimerase/dehydratase family protein [Ornithinicoccus halotolerans]